MAIGRYRELQARFEQLEEELSKKRGELRELLRQDSNSSGGRLYQNRERDTAEAERPINGKYSDTNGNSADPVKKGSLSVIINAGDERLGESQSNGSHAKVDPSSNHPKLEIKTPEKTGDNNVSPGQESKSSLDEAAVDMLNNIEQKLNPKLKVEFNKIFISEFCIKYAI